MAFFSTWENRVNFTGGRGIVLNRKKYEERNKQTIQKLTSLPKIKAIVFGYQNFKPSNVILLALIPWCPIIAVPLPEHYVIFSMFSGGLISIFLSNFTTFLITNFEVLVR